ncbi:MAG: DUF3572 domain-containing protein [Rhodobacteraceae bacterium]|nr:DUF3572 domain-containing protein [Paracoccaceae bacterium]
MAYERDNAEVIALKALAWLAGNEELLPLFLGSSGLAPGELAARASEPEMLGSVLDFILMDDVWVQGFCDAERLPYERLMMVRAALPGGAQTHWT